MRKSFLNYENNLEEWKEIIHIVKENEIFIKFQGIYQDCHVDLMRLPIFTTQNIRAMQIKEELLDFVEQESAKLAKRAQINKLIKKEEQKQKRCMLICIDNTYYIKRGLYENNIKY